MLTKRNNSPYWQIEFTLRGRTVRQSSRTTDRKAAEELEQRLREQVWKQTELGVQVPKTWDDAIERWNAESVHKRKSTLQRETIILTLAQTEFKGRPLQEVAERLDGYITVIAEHTSNSNANRHLATIKAMINKARKVWRWPIPEPIAPRRTVEQKDPRWLTKEEWTRLYGALMPYQRPVAEFALETGLRIANILELRWARPAPGNREVWPWVSEDLSMLCVPGPVSKSGHTVAIPLSTAARNLLVDMERSKTGYVFVGASLQPTTGGGMRNGWNAACQRAGLGGLRFHDLRHTWASWHLQRGTHKRVVQELGGWRSPAMVDHYSHLSIEHLKEHVK